MGFREAFSLLPSCICGFIWSNTVELGGFRKEVCFSDESQYPYEDSCESLSHSWQGRGSLAIYPNCRIVLIELFNTIPSQFLLILDNSYQVFLGRMLKTKLCRNNGYYDTVNKNDVFLYRKTNQRFGLILLHSEMGGTMFKVTSSSRILHK